MIASKWNINLKENQILLPNEIPAADIVGLPAHCPWSTRSHKKYSQSMKKELKEVNKQIKKAVKDSKCEEIDQVKTELNKVSIELYEKIIKLEKGNIL